MQQQQRSRGVSTVFDRFLTHPAPLEPISVVRFARYCGRRHHSLRQLRFVPLPVNVWSIETYDKRAPGDRCCINTFPFQLRQCIVPQHPKICSGNESQYSTCPRSRRHQRQVVDWFKKVRFTSILFTAALITLYPAFCCPGQLLRWSYKGFS